MVMEIKSDNFKYLQPLILLFLTALLFAITSCGNTKTVAKAEQTAAPVPQVNKISSNIKTLDVFLDGFEAATMSHNPSNILGYLDKAYKKEQWENYLNKNTDSFLNKFYSNNQLTDGSPTIQYKSISKITRTKFNYQNAYMIVTYIVEAGNRRVEMDLTVFSRLNKGELTYTIYGPIG